MNRCRSADWAQPCRCGCSQRAIRRRALCRNSSSCDFCRCGCRSACTSTRPTVRSRTPGSDALATNAADPVELRASDTAVDGDAQAGGVAAWRGRGWRPATPPCPGRGQIADATHCLPSPNTAKLRFQGRGRLRRVHRGRSTRSPRPRQAATPPADPCRGVAPRRPIRAEGSRPAVSQRWQLRAEGRPSSTRISEGPAWRVLGATRAPLLPSRSSGSSPPKPG